jgi:hypothetical protein
VTRADVARNWLLEGASAQLQGHHDAAKGPLAAARRAAPTVFDTRLGPDVRAAWEAATPTGAGTLLLEPARPAFLDGEGIAEWPVPVDDAPHLVQVVGPNGTVLFGREVNILAGDDALVQTGLGTAEPLPEIPPSPPREVAEKRSPAMLIVAGVAAAGAGACAGGAYAQEPQMKDAKSENTLNAAFTRQQVFGYTTYGLAGVAAAAFTLHFVLP